MTKKRTTIIGGISSVLSLLAAVVAGAEPQLTTELDEHVDLIEVNHFYDGQGRLVFDQVIFYNWDLTTSRFQIVDWRLLKSDSQIPIRDWRKRYYVAIWNDFKQKDVLRRTTCDNVRETWTQHDPELQEREFLPQEQRRSLRAVWSVKK